MLADEPDTIATRRQAPNSSLRRVVVPLLLLFGLQVSIVIGRGAWPPNRGVTGALLAAILIGLVAAATWRTTHRIGARTAGFIARQRWLATGVIFAAAVAYLFATARFQGRTFWLKYQDEFSYAIQTQMVAHGRFWMPAHPLADFFDSFQLLIRPVYASIYFPGAAMAYAPGVWTQAPSWLVPLLLSGACVALLFLIITEMLDGIAGTLAAVTLVGLTIFRLQSIMVMAQIPSLAACLAATWCWLRWRTSPHPTGWAAAVGVAMGWAAITRPVDALCFAVPIGLAMLLAAAQNPPRRLGLPVAVLAMLPFAAIQLSTNRGVTGSFVTTPFSFYAARDYPGTQYGFGHYRAGDQPASALPQKRAYYETDVRPVVSTHSPATAARRWAQKNAPETILLGIPHAILIALLPAGAWAALSRRGIPMAIVAPFPLFVLLYWPYAFFLPHYTLIAAPAIIAMLMLGRAAAMDLFPPGRSRTAIGAMLAAVIGGVALVELPEFNRLNADEFFPATGLTQIDKALAGAIPPGERAVVLFRYPSDGGNPHEEPVYNPSAAWPDDARIIRAHDLGERNIELLRYYAKLQPGRVIWRYDRGSGELTRLGAVGDLAGR